MPLHIRTNTSALWAQKNTEKSQAKLQKSFNRLSRGFRINSAADDAAGLAISENMTSQIRSFVVAERNASDGRSMAQTAEGSLGEIHNVLGRMRELAMQSGSGMMSSTDREFIQTEFSALQEEIGRIQTSTKFNGKSLVDQTATSVSVQVGLNNTGADQISIRFGGLDLSAIRGSGTSLGGSTADSALASLSAIDAAISSVSESRSNFGAAMNRLDAATRQIQTQRTNLAEANSRLRDADIAAETAALAQNQIMAQVGVAVQAQANALPQLAYSLLGE